MSSDFRLSHFKLDCTLANDEHPRGLKLTVFSFLCSRNVLDITRTKSIYCIFFFSTTSNPLKTAVLTFCIQFNYCIFLQRGLKGFCPYYAPAVSLKHNFIFSIHVWLYRTIVDFCGGIKKHTPKKNWLTRVLLMIMMGRGFRCMPYKLKCANMRTTRMAGYLFKAFNAPT